MTRRKRKPRRATYRETARLRKLERMLDDIARATHIAQFVGNDLILGAVRAADVAGAVITVSHAGGNTFNLRCARVKL